MTLDDRPIANMGVDDATEALDRLFYGITVGSMTRHRGIFQRTEHLEE